MYIKNIFFQHHEGAPYFFKDFSLNIESGKIHALHGKNGTGKTMLFNILSQRLDKAAILRGEVCAKNLGLVNQQFDRLIADQFTFEENLKFAHMNFFPSPFKGLFKQPLFFKEFLEKFHIDLSLPVHRLSGGQRQILALLMQLQIKRDILLLDEPTATLDEQNAIMVFEFLHHLKGITFLIICHDHELIKRYATGEHFYLEIDSSGVRRLKIPTETN